MTNEQLEQRLRDWYRDEIPVDETAPAALRSSLAAIPRDSSASSRRLRSPRGFTLLAAAALVVVLAGSLAAGGILRDRPAPSDGLLSASPPLVPSPSPVSTHRMARNGAIAVTREGVIALIDPVTGETVKTLPVSSAEPGDLTWAPDGRRLAFTAPGGVWVMDVSDGTSQQILTCGEGPDGCSLSWAPDGSRIAVAHGDTLELVDPDGSNRTTLFVQGHPVNYAGLSQPTWSPDGTRIAFNGWIGSGRGLYTINRDGTDPAPILGPVPGIGAFDPAWSPDGSTIAYVGSTDIRVCEKASPSSCGDQWLLHVMSVALDGSEPRDLHEAGTCYCIGGAPSLTWSPDGTSIAFVGFRSDSFPGGLTVMNPDGTGLRQVTEDGGGPAWQPVP
jgi:Tol biopolymer transport system component